MTKNLVKFNIRISMFLFLLVISACGAIFGALIDAGAHASLISGFMVAWPLVITGAIISQGVCALAIAYNSTRRCLIRATLLLMAVYSAFACIANILARSIITQVTDKAKFGYIITRSELMAKPLENIASAALDLVFCFSFAVFGCMLVGLGKRLPTKATVAMWLGFILLVDSITFFGDDIFRQMRAPSQLQVGLITVTLLALSLSMTVFCFKTFDAKSRVLK